MLCHLEESQLAFTHEEATRLFRMIGAPCALVAPTVQLSRGRAAALVAAAYAATSMSRLRAGS